jgi:hypothetical protein
MLVRRIFLRISSRNKKRRLPAGCLLDVTRYAYRRTR